VVVANGFFSPELDRAGQMIFEQVIAQHVKSIFPVIKQHIMPVLCLNFTK
jgi:hypothetical protein